MTRMKSVLLFLLFFLCAIPAYAQDMKIAVVVNDDAITTQDINDRLALAFLSSGLPQDEETRKRVRERVIRNLIDEKLQLQEAKRYDIEVPQGDIDAAFASVAKQNKIAPEELEALMQRGHVPKETLILQIRAALSWTRLVQRVLRPQVTVGDDEVNSVLERVKANEGKPEYLLSEIFLNVENPADEAKAKDLADELTRRMKSGTPFAVIAQQFSQGTGAINGGDLGWIQPGQLPGDLDKVARTLEPRQISAPIRTPDGFHIIGKREERIISAVQPGAIQVHLRQASLPLHGRSMIDVKSEVERFRETVNSCNTLTSRLDQFPEWTQSDLGEKRLGELPPWLGNLAQNAPVNEPSQVMEKNGYALLLYVCSRNDSGADRAAVMATLGNEKLEMQARRLLRDLHRSASIDMREG
jgi:peptidyl-prolyl cis-trans isomerase SurA